MSWLPTGFVRDIIQTLVLTVVIFFAVQTFVGQPYQVEMVSMQHTLEPGHYVFVDKLTPRVDAYHRGDIVVFWPTSQSGRVQEHPFIKRVIGVAGETVEVRDGRVWIDDEVLDEPYVFSDGGEAQATTITSESRWVIPEGQLFLLGDHRSNSVDSRSFGPVGVGQVVGRAWLRYWPLDSLAILGGSAQATAIEPLETTETP
jgi:signal peptidase I